MQLKKYEIKTYVTKEVHQWVTKEAVARNTTMAKVIRDGLMQYFLLREELANSIETPDQMGNDHSGKIIHTLLSRSEQRMAILIEQIEKQILCNQELINYLIVMIDRFYLSLMQYIPEIPDRIKNSTSMTSIARHKKWLDEIQKILAKSL